MKKTILTILITAIATAVIIIGAYMIYKCNPKETKQATNTEKLEVLDGPGSVHEPKEYSDVEWEKLTEQFYEENYGYKPTKIECIMKENSPIYIYVSSGDMIIEEYILNNETGVATSVSSRPMNLLTGKFDDEVPMNVNFVNQQCLAVGYVPNGKEDEIKNKVFIDKDTMDNITTINLGDRCEFLVVPRERNATVKVWSYAFTEDYELYLDELVIESKGTPLLIKTEDTEVVPKVAIEYDCDGVNFVIPLIFSGMDGKLFFDDDHIQYIVDVSIYE